MHHGRRGLVAVRSRTEGLAVDGEGTLQDDDRVRDAVMMSDGSHALGVVHEIVLVAGARVDVQLAQSDWRVVDDWLS